MYEQVKEDVEAADSGTVDDFQMHASGIKLHPDFT